MAIRCGAPLCRLLLLVGFLKLPGACVHLRPRDLLAAELVLGFSHIALGRYDPDRHQDSFWSAAAWMASPRDGQEPTRCHASTAGSCKLSCQRGPIRSTRQ